MLSKLPHVAACYDMDVVIVVVICVRNVHRALNWFACVFCILCAVKSHYLLTVLCYIAVSH